MHLILINKHNDRNAYISQEISFVVNERIFSIDGKGQGRRATKSLR